MDLSHNNLGPEGAKAIAPAIRDSQSLTECNPRQNSLGDEGWCAIFDALRDNPQNKITKWKLGGHGIDAEIAKSLAAYMAVSHSLTECNLRDNYLCKKGWCAIFDALRNNPQNKITKWELKGQSIDAEIAKSLAAYMAVSHSLSQVLALSPALTHCSF